MILLYRKGEAEQNGVPTAVYEVLTDTDIPSIFLKKNTYEIIILDKNYQIQNKYTSD